MTADADISGAAERAMQACVDTVAKLRQAAVAAESLAEYVPPRRVLLWTRPATMRGLGEVWRLGALLLGADASLYAAGRATRAAERGRPGYQSVSREERREIAAAALRGGYEAGSPVNFDAVPIPLDAASLASSATGPSGETETSAVESPVGFADGEVRVRWRAGAPLAGAPTLASFLAERAGLLIDPPL
jgi:hypothetical protein